MTKQSIRSFGFGLLTAAAALFIFNSVNEPDQLTTAQMIQLLQKKNYTVQTEEKRVSPSAPFTLNEKKSNPSYRGVTISFETGSLDETAVKLKQAGLIEDTSAYRNYITENGLSKKLRAGTYTFESGMSMNDIAGILSK